MESVVPIVNPFGINVTRMLHGTVNTALPVPDLLVIIPYPPSSVANTCVKLALNVSTSVILFDAIIVTFPDLFLNETLNHES